MKSHQTLVLLIFGVSFAACKKESPIQSMSNASSQQNAVTAGCNTCRDVDPSDFVKGVDNPYYPLKPGTSLHYVNKSVEDGDLIISRNIVTITSRIKHILGVPCTVVHDQVITKGKVTEDTYDWFAQDKHGNVWYFGEATKALTNHGWSTEGSWEAGVDGGCAGIIMWAHPEAHIGQIYYQEFEHGTAEDQAKVISTNNTVTVDYGTYNNCVHTQEFSRLEPGVIDNKYYAKGIGEIKQVTRKGAQEFQQLVNITH
jgi:hypothetical protein